MTYVSKINNISYSGNSRSVNMKLSISAEVYEALRVNSVIGSVEAVSSIGDARVKTAMGNLTISNASFLKVSDNVEISIKKDTLIIEKVNTTGKPVQLNLKPQPENNSISIGLLNKIDQIKKDFEQGQYQPYEIKIDDVAGSFLEVIQSMFLEDSKSTAHEVFDLSKALSWSLMFLPLKLDDQQVLARLFVKSFENKKYKNLIMECEHPDLGNCIVLVKLETSSFSSVDLSVITDKEMPKELQSDIRNAADDLACNIGFSYKLEFVVDHKKASHSMISDLLAEYCIGRAANTIA